MKTLGIIGGLGPGTTAEFYLGLIERCRSLYPTAYPRVLIDSVAVPFALEENVVIRGQGIEDYLPLLRESAGTLESAGADLIALPCNTVHELHGPVQEVVSIPLLNILEATAAACSTAGHCRVAVLGTRRTVEGRLYSPALQAAGIQEVAITPTELSQSTGIIYELVSGRQSPDNRSRLIEIIAAIAERGAEAVILGCTDLQLAIRPGDADLPLPLVDSVDALIGETAVALGR